MQFVILSTLISIASVLQSIDL